MKIPKQLKFWKIWKRLRKRKPWTRAGPVRRANAELARFPKHADAPRHSLPGELIVSMTSYPPRYPFLKRTLCSLLDQTVRADKIVLWIAHGDMAALPQDILDLQNERLAIEQCEDIRNFKRIVPAMDRYPGTFMIFVDDDMYYPSEWLERMVDAFDPSDPTVIAYRCSRIRHEADGSLATYRSWPNAYDRKAERPSRDLLPINQMGVLYPPGSLPPMTKDYSLIQELSPTSDEVWLFFMWQQAGWRVKRVPGPLLDFAEWPDSQEQALWKLHRGGRKDEHFRTMAERFGTPPLG